MSAGPICTTSAACASLASRCSVIICDCQTRNAYLSPGVAKHVVERKLDPASLATPSRSAHAESSMGCSGSSVSSSAAAAHYPYRLTDAEWRQKLTSAEYRVLRQGGTEAPGTGEFCNFFPSNGHFVCRACDIPLYSSASKFKDRGWDACAHRTSITCQIL